MITRYIKPKKLKNTVLLDTEHPVQSGLAVTPSEMLELTNKGIPISPVQLGLLYEEGVSNLDFEPSLEFKRGVDIADMYESRFETKKKFKSPQMEQLLRSNE